MSLIRKHGAVLQAWACLDLVHSWIQISHTVLFTVVAVSDWRSIIQSEPIRYLMEASATVSLIRQILLLTLDVQKPKSFQLQGG